MSKQKTDKGIVHFRIESRLLEELGERLVSSPDIALSELVKNSYDADSSECEIDFKRGEYLRVIDNGHGMNLHDFKSRWMTIATKEKLLQILSPNYGRFLTGAKGVGRFAARTLGSSLIMESTAFDSELNMQARLTAMFDWKEFDKNDNLSELAVSYEYKYPVEEENGTFLEVRGLYHDIDEDVIKKVRNNVLDIASPHKLLMPDNGFWQENIDVLKKQSAKNKNNRDPGFTILINNEDKNDLGPAEVILNAYVGRAKLELVDDVLSIVMDFKGHKKIRKRIKYKNIIGSPVSLDIRYFPIRVGVFSGLGIDGRMARTWKAKHHGVAVYDKGFRISPFGLGENDWLSLDIDNARKERNWRSPLSKKYIPIPEQDKSSEYRNPMVNIITNFQVVGCVSVCTDQKKKRGMLNIKPDYLVPSMDREGYLDNAGLQQLKDITRFAVEYLTYTDNRIKIELDVEVREEKEKTIKKELVTAINTVRSSKTLKDIDKKRIITQYKSFQKDIDEYEDYNRRSRENMDIMGFLGVLAGFMTHEHESVLWAIEKVSKKIKNLPLKKSDRDEILSDITKSIDAITGYIEYTRVYIGAIDNKIDVNLKVKPRVRHAISTVKPFIIERDISVEIECQRDELMPAMPIPMFEGIVLNLFTNAVKALVTEKRIDAPTILIVCWTDTRNHYVTVSDNGIGIERALQKHIWDPLFTTTSGGKNPLGSGMGLGLPLVKRVLTSIGGGVELADAPTGYNTCFKVSIPRETFYGKN